MNIMFLFYGHSSLLLSTCTILYLFGGQAPLRAQHDSNHRWLVSFSTLWDQIASWSEMCVYLQEQVAVSTQNVLQAESLRCCREDSLSCVDNTVAQIEASYT